MRKKSISAVLSLSMAVSMLGAVSLVAAGEEKETVRVLVPGLSEQSTVDPISGLETKSRQEFEDYLNEMIPDYSIEVKTIPWDGWIQSTEAMATSGDIDVGFFTNQEAVPDWYQDLTPYLEKDEEVNLENIADIYNPPANQYIYYKSFNHPESTGNIYGLPITMACNMIMYDSKIFEDYGIEEPTSETTLSELVDMAEKMTGTDPVTGKQTYGGFVYTSWTEWYAISYNAVKPYFSDTMDINDLDKEEYVDYIKTSPEVQKFFDDLIRFVKCCNPAVATGSGAENWMTEDNDIAITLDANKCTAPFMKYVYAGDEEITSRFKYLLVPAGENGEGFPEFFRFAIAQKANDADAAWDVIKELTTNKEIIDFYLTNYATDKVSCLKDVEGISMMNDYEINKERVEYQSENLFITDDYWYWRSPLQTVINDIISGGVTDSQEAADEFYEGVDTWVENVKAQSK